MTAIAIFAVMCVMGINIVYRGHRYTIEHLGRFHRLHVGDSEWPARGKPAAVGDRVRFVDVEGNRPRVEPEQILPA